MQEPRHHDMGVVNTSLEHLTRRFGAKAGSLLLLTELPEFTGIIPKMYCVGREVFDSFLDANPRIRMKVHRVEQLLLACRTKDEFLAGLAECGNLPQVVEAHYTKWLRTEYEHIQEEITSLFGDLPLVIRSSGSEDSPGSTNAGGNLSYLDVRPDQSLQYIARVTAGYFSRRSLIQRHRELRQSGFRGLGHENGKEMFNAGCAVLIQEQVGGAESKDQPSHGEYSPGLSAKLVCEIFSWLGRLGQYLPYESLDTEWVIRSTMGLISAVAFSAEPVGGAPVGVVHCCWGLGRATRNDTRATTYYIVPGGPDGPMVFQSSASPLIARVPMPQESPSLVQVRPLNLTSSEGPELVRATGISTIHAGSVMFDTTGQILVKGWLRGRKSLIVRTIDDAWRRYLMLTEDDLHSLGPVIVSEGSSLQHSAIMFAQACVPVIRVDKGSLKRLVDASEEGYEILADPDTGRIVVIPQGSPAPKNPATHSVPNYPAIVLKHFEMIAPRMPEFTLSSRDFDLSQVCVLLHELRSRLTDDPTVYDHLKIVALTTELCGALGTPSISLYSCLNATVQMTWFFSHAAAQQPLTAMFLREVLYQIWVPYEADGSSPLQSALVGFIARKIWESILDPNTTMEINLPSEMECLVAGLWEEILFFSLRSSRIPDLRMVPPQWLGLKQALQTIQLARDSFDTIDGVNEDSRAMARYIAEISQLRAHDLPGFIHTYVGSVLRLPGSPLNLWRALADCDVGLSRNRSLECYLPEYRQAVQSLASCLPEGFVSRVTSLISIVRFCSHVLLKPALKMWSSGCDSAGRLDAVLGRFHYDIDPEEIVAFAESDRGIDLEGAIRCLTKTIHNVDLLSSASGYDQETRTILDDIRCNMLSSMVDLYDVAAKGTALAVVEGSEQAYYQYISILESWVHSAEQYLGGCGESGHLFLRFSAEVLRYLKAHYNPDLTFYSERHWSAKLRRPVHRVSLHEVHNILHQGSLSALRSLLATATVMRHEELQLVVNALGRDYHSILRDSLDCIEVEVGSGSTPHKSSCTIARSSLSLELRESPYTADRQGTGRPWAMSLWSTHIARLFPELTISSDVREDDSGHVFSLNVSARDRVHFTEEQQLDALRLAATLVDAADWAGGLRVWSIPICEEILSRSAFYRELIGGMVSYHRQLEGERFYVPHINKYSVLLGRLTEHCTDFEDLEHHGWSSYEALKKSVTGFYESHAGESKIVVRHGNLRIERSKWWLGDVLGLILCMLYPNETYRDMVEHQKSPLPFANVGYHLLQRTDVVHQAMNDLRDISQVPSKLSSDARYLATLIVKNNPSALVCEARNDAVIYNLVRKMIMLSRPMLRLLDCVVAYEVDRMALGLQYSCAFGKAVERLADLHSIRLHPTTMSRIISGSSTASLEKVIANKQILDSRFRMQPLCWRQGNDWRLCWKL